MSLKNWIKSVIDQEKTILVLRKRNAGLAKKYKKAAIRNAALALRVKDLERLVNQLSP